MTNLKTFAVAKQNVDLEVEIDFILLWNFPVQACSVLYKTYTRVAFAYINKRKFITSEAKKSPESHILMRSATFSSPPFFQILFMLLKELIFTTKHNISIERSFELIKSILDTGLASTFLLVFVRSEILWNWNWHQQRKSCVERHDKKWHIWVAFLLSYIEAKIL